MGSKEELEDYMIIQAKWAETRVRRGPAKKKMWMGLNLSGIKKYSVIQKPERFIPVGGQYIRE
jgi:hypothetical protein